MADPRCSILLVTRNAAGHLERLLPALAAQRLDGGVELVAVDSDSEDGTRELLESAGARVVRIDAAAFRHGPTRNLCAEQARGELLVFLSQDALPDGDRFLGELLAPFDDPRVAGTCARILPHAGDDPLTARTVLSLPEAGGGEGADEATELASADAGDPAALRFNNVASAVRAQVLRELPFPDVGFGEDCAWAEDVLAAGHRLYFCPSSIARHAHAYSSREAFRRYRTDAAFQRERWGRRVRPDLLSVARGFLHEVREDLRFLARNRPGSRWRHTFRSPLLRGAQVLGQYLGSRG
ncbi:MAG: glycosyltransferase [Planctomycetota bacterium]|jgi:rhamnosyltransferase|nr:glycosyltransferase [Planctomycetota bacterium]MDP6761770.1 glycosyltransferase [Planctomycetota bacterium]MDP6988028.1 glycosyltransferase [Planctomycetota bacterium]